MTQWHSDFNPHRFLKNINVDALLSKNDAYETNIVEKLGKPCILCNGIQSPGLLLNDKSYLCKRCFEKISFIQYPEKYETIRRNYVSSREAWNQARQKLIEFCNYRKFANLINVVGWISLLLLFINMYLMIIPVFLFASRYNLLSLHKQKVRDWANRFSEPKEPILKHFHDPSAEMTENDHIILHIFDHWPGYPPYWAYLREVVLSRDNNRCQVTGCPSRVSLHIHHGRPVSKGGAHCPTNLVTLCAFHHGLEPDTGHALVWADVKTKYFTLVREHERQNRATDGYHNVRAHLRRLELISEAELASIMSYYDMSCPFCSGMYFTGKLNKEKTRIIIKCTNCDNAIEGPRQLAEETGPRLADILICTKNKGVYQANWEMLSYRKDEKWGEWVKGKKKATVITKKNRLQMTCPLCGAPMKRIVPRSGDKWPTFWGCSKYNTTGCKGSVKE